MWRVALLSAGLAALAVAALVLVLLDRDDTATALAWIAALISVLALLAPIALRRYDRLALGWFRLRNRLWRSPALPWRLGVTLSGDFAAPGYFERLERSLRDALSGRIRTLQPAPSNGRQLAIDGLGLVELVLDDLQGEDAENRRLHLDFTGLRVAPHEAEQVLAQEILPLVRMAENAADHPSREQSWSLQVSLDVATNPYLPVLLRDRDPASVSAFRVVYVSAHGPDRVDLGKDTVRLSAGTAESFAALVRDFVTFSGRGLRPPETRA